MATKARCPAQHLPWSLLPHRIDDALSISRPSIQIVDRDRRNFEGHLYRQFMEPLCVAHTLGATLSATFWRTVIRRGFSCLRLNLQEARRGGEHQDQDQESIPCVDSIRS
jgi:hypothetical protein